MKGDERLALIERLCGERARVVEALGDIGRTAEAASGDLEDGINAELMAARAETEQLKASLGSLLEQCNKEDRNTRAPYRYLHTTEIRAILNLPATPRCVSCNGDLVRQGDAWVHLGTPGCDFLIVPEHLQ